MPPGSFQPFYKKCLLLAGRRMILVQAAWLLGFVAVISAQSTARALYSVGDEEKSCEVGGVQGKCMFVWQCMNSSGTHMGVCMDKFIFGSCCIHPNTTTLVGEVSGGGSAVAVPFTSPPKRPAVDMHASSSIPHYSTIYIPSSTTAVTLRPTDLLVITNRPSFVTKPQSTSSQSLLDKWNVKPWENEIDNHVETSWHTTSFATKVRPTTGWLHVTTQQRPGTTTRRPTSAWYNTASTTTPRPTHPTTKKPHTTSRWQTARPTKHRPNTGWTNSAKPTTTRPTNKWPSSPWTKPVYSTARPTTKRTTTTTTKPTTTTTPSTTTTPPPFMFSANITNTQCGIRSYQKDIRPEVRIVGGRNAQFGDWPWQVSVRRTSFFGFSSTHRCGGALINDRWIATAGHCVDDLLVSQIRLRVGEYDFSSTVEPYPHVERGAARKVVHPNYNFFTYEHDLALVRMDGQVEFGPNISPICLPASDDLLVSETATITGWGRLSDGGTLPSVLQEVSVPILSNVRCRYLFLRAGRHEFFPEIFLCAGLADGGRDACQGDSGGPLQVRGRDNRYFLAGIISWGIGCAEANLPGVCTRISKFVPWILQTVT